MTNREIAQKLGISPAALSLIINHKPGVSDSTRDRVLTELQEMGCDNLIKKHRLCQATTCASLFINVMGRFWIFIPFSSF